MPDLPLRTVLPAVLSTALMLSLSPPASAASTGATVTVEGGALSLTVDADAGNLATVANTLEGAVVTGSLGQVEVDDARSAAPGSGWVVSVLSSDFTAPAAPLIPASGVAYTAGPIETEGTVEVVAEDPTDLSALTAAVTASGITGDNYATWTPTITVTIPGSSPTGIYSATITHSVI